MRISDWSSDVCSSDLRHRDPPAPVHHGQSVINETGKAAAFSGDEDVIQRTKFVETKWSSASRMAGALGHDEMLFENCPAEPQAGRPSSRSHEHIDRAVLNAPGPALAVRDRQSTRLNSSH